MHKLLTRLLPALSLLTACAAAPAPTPAPAPAAAQRKAPEAPPAWMEGDYPQEPLLFGRGAGNDPEHAAEAALPGLQQELQILVKILKHDHEEQVAEIVSRYPPEDFNARVDQALTVALAKATPHATFREDNSQVDVVHVLLALDPAALFEALEASDLPEPQKARLRDYRVTFTQNVLTNLGRR